MFLALASLYAAFALRFGAPIPINYFGDSWGLFLLLPLVLAPLVLALRLPSIKLHAFESNAVIRIGICAIGLSLATMVLSYALGLGAPRSVPLIVLRPTDRLTALKFFNETIPKTWLDFRVQVTDNFHIISHQFLGFGVSEVHCHLLICGHR